MRDNQPLCLLTPAGDGDAFGARVVPYLLDDEAIHCLLLGLMAHQASAFLGLRQFAVARSDEIVTLAGITPPRNLVLSRVADDRAVPFLVNQLQQQDVEIPGVIGPEPHAGHLAAAWKASTGQQAQHTMRQRVFQADAVRVPTSVAGSARAATPADRPLLLDWVGRFVAESMPPDVRAVVDAETMVDSRFGEGAGWLLWLNAAGEPVSLAGFGSPTPNGIRIGPVYTPPAHRRRGYGSAVTAATTRLLLDRGHRFVFLFTDLANPTSNHIYREIGYEPVADFGVYTFSSQEGGH